jgi:hypothetical protein
MILGRSILSRHFFTSFAAAFLYLLLASPAFCQGPDLGSVFGFAALPTYRQSGDQSPAQNNSQGQVKQSKKEKQNSGRLFYVMPNYLTVENEANVPPISWKQKFVITSKGAFDPYEFTIVGALAGIRQAQDAYPAFGEGAEGYGKRYGAALADQVDGNIMVGGVFPSLLKTDPRYFQMGRGGFVRRFGYALSRIFVTRRDSGGSLFNFPEFVGNASAIAISNVYYPASDRGFTSGLNNWGVQMGIDAFGDELKEFWPDIHRHFAKRKNSPSPQAIPAD